MKKLKIILVLVAVTLAASMQAKAHAVWIESHAKAAKSRSHLVKVFSGEYPEGEVEPTSKWYSDLKSLEVWVTSPSKKKTKLTLTDANDHLVSSFIPTEDGIYYITTAHTTKDLGGTTKYQFSSVASVIAGNASTTPSYPEDLLSVIASPKVYKPNDEVEFKVWNGNTAFANGEVKIMSPEGWVKTIKADQNGTVSFTPRLKGSYVIETSDYKKEAGEWNQKQYSHSWKGSTTRILVN